MFKYFNCVLACLCHIVSEKSSVFVKDPTDLMTNVYGDTLVTTNGKMYHKSPRICRCDWNKPTSSDRWNSNNCLRLDLIEYFLLVAAFQQASLVLCDSCCDFWTEEWSNLFPRWGGVSSPPVPLQPADRTLFGIMERLHQQVCEAPLLERFCGSTTWRESCCLKVSSSVVLLSVCQRHLQDLSVR